MEGEEDRDAGWAVIELEWSEWSSMLRNFKCYRPNCNKGLTRRTNRKTGTTKLACENCKVYYEPPKPREKVTEKDLSLRRREAAAQRSGGSLYPPLPIYYYCEGCHDVALKRIETRNRYEQEAGVQLTLPKGDEGFTYTLVQQHLILPLALSETFPFTCACGQRYYADIRLIRRDKKIHPLFAVELGFHVECMACRNSFDQGTTQDHFQFRCDHNTDCKHFHKLRQTNPERVWIIEELT